MLLDTDKNRKSSARKTNYHLKKSSERSRDSTKTITRGVVDRQTLRKRREKKRKQQQQMMLLLVAVVAVLLVSLCISFAFRKNGYEILVQEEVVATVKGKAVTQEDLIKTVTAQLKEERGTNISINEAITIKPVHVKGKPITIDAAITEIKKNITYKVEAAVITADGVEIAILNNVEEANTLLEEIQNEYIPEEKAETMKAEFVQEVKVATKFVHSEEIMTKDMTKEKFVAGTQTQKPYTVVDGDNLYKIAGKTEMTVEEILAVNPGMTISTPLRIGEQINITATIPFLSVKTIETVTFIEKKAKEVEYQQDNTKSGTYKKVIQQGKDGQQEVTEQIIRINGFEEETKVVNTNIIQEPVKEIIVVGTK